MQTVARIMGVLTLAAVTAFCALGFLAAFEYAEPSKRLPWQVGYGLVGLGCLVGGTMLLRPRRRGLAKRADVSP